MALEQEFKDCVNETITVTPAVDHGLFGAVELSTASVTYTAFLDEEDRMIPRGDGGVERVTGVLYVMSSSGHIQPTDKVMLSDGREVHPLRVNHTRDNEGQHHIEMLLGPNPPGARG